MEPPVTTNDYLREAAKTQRETLKHAREALSGISEIEALGSATSIALKENTQRMQREIGEVKEIRDDLTIGRRRLTSLTRRLQTDKICMLLICLLLLAIIVFIIVAAVYPNEVFSKESSKEQ